jgi:hypothetical protein
LSLYLAASCSLPDYEFNGDGGAGRDLEHCENDETDADETDLNCGGEDCERCDVGDSCNEDSDCQNESCIDGQCQDAACTDEEPGDDETDVDCGGVCPPCEPGQMCREGSDCTSGVCVAEECAEPTCDDRTVNGLESDLDCGGTECQRCGGGSICDVPSDCVSETCDCVDEDCTERRCRSSCPDGLSNCDGDPETGSEAGCETNIRTSADHCGECGAACDLPNADAECSGGRCRIMGCEEGFEDCDGDVDNGCEVDLSGDADNCGACNAQCFAVNGTPLCEDSECQIDCDEGFDDCDNDRANGCERPTSRDVLNCGECGNVCESEEGGTPWCDNGVCGETVCDDGFGDCNADPDDDCETELDNDPENCGTCGGLCVVANGVGRCDDGECVIDDCTAPFDDCVGGYADGCETNTETSIAHCGACGDGCTVANGEALCDAGDCTIRSCTAPFDNCSGGVADGCETNLSTSQTNCGGCGSAGVNCNTRYPNASATCNAQMCAFTGCNLPFSNCNTDLSDGCERNLQTDEAACGSCGTTCQQVNVQSNDCNGGACDVMCATGFRSCDSNPNNGCERNINTDEGHCGGCNIVCQSGSSAHVQSNDCNGGSCNPICQNGWARCSGTPATAGCLTQLGTAQNCTGCGVSCSGSTPFCSASGCVGVQIVNSNARNGVVNWSGGSWTLSADHTLQTATASGANRRLVLVGVGAIDTAAAPTSVRYTSNADCTGGTAKTTPVALDWGNGDGSTVSWAGIYAFLDNEVGGTGAKKACATFPAGAGGATINVLEFRNANQSGSFVSATLDGGSCGPGGSTSSPGSMTVPVATGGSFIYTLAAVRGDNRNPDSTYATSTPGYNESMYWGDGNHVGIGAYIGPTGSNASVTWQYVADTSMANSWAWCERWGAVAVTVRPPSN